MTHTTDREMSNALHDALRQQVESLRKVAVHAPMGYLSRQIEQAALLLESANAAWREEEQQAGAPLWR